MYNNIESVGNMAFSGCSIGNIVFHGTSEEWYNHNYGIEYEESIVFLKGNFINGTCGENVSYCMNYDTGNLSISGTGDMDNYYGLNSPFKNNKEIKSITIDDGVGSIGFSAFYGCTNLQSVTIPTSVTKISLFAFVSCGDFTVNYMGNRAQWEELDYSPDFISVNFDGEPDDNPGVHFSYDESTFTLTISGTGGTGSNKEIIPAKGHDFGEWEIIQSATVNSAGLKQHTCIKCGKVEEDVIPPFGVKLVLPETVEMKCKSELYLDRQIINHDNLSYTTKWESSDPEAADVDIYGNITALKPGKAKITCTVTDQDGNVFKDSCTVKIKYNLIQWILNLFLFGWIWY